MVQLDNHGLRLRQDLGRKALDKPAHPGLLSQVCVCVRAPCSHRDPFGLCFLLSAKIFQQGDMACVQGPCPTKLPDARDMRADHSHVPAFSTAFQLLSLPLLTLQMCTVRRHPVAPLPAYALGHVSI